MRRNNAILLILVLAICGFILSSCEPNLSPADFPIASLSDSELYANGFWRVDDKMCHSYIWISNNDDKRCLESDRKEFTKDQYERVPDPIDLKWRSYKIFLNLDTWDIRIKKY